MGPGYRPIRAAASALIISAAIGAGGMTGMTSVLAADPHVDLSAKLVDGSGAPIGGVHLRITEELPPDGGLVAFQVVTAPDGTFGAALQPWGTAAAPAKVTIATGADEAVTVVGPTCSQTVGVTASTSADLALADGPPEPLTVTATTTILGEVCGTTATPPPANGPAGGQSGGGRLTPPPTDTDLAGVSSAADRNGPALTIGFLVGLLVAAVMLASRPGMRRRR